MKPMPCNALLHPCVRFLWVGILCCLAAPAAALPFTFSTGNPDGRMATASRTGTGAFGIETADDFVLSQQTRITHATFTGLLAGNNVSTADINFVGIEIYRVFPADSDVGRTSGSPTFTTSLVPTRVNSPSDVALDSRDSAANTLSFSTSILSSSFTVSNSIQPGGIHPKPNQTTGGMERSLAWRSSLISRS